MPTSGSTARSSLAIVAGVAAAAFVSPSVAADAPANMRARPGQWETQSRIEVDGKFLVRGPESEADRVMREAHARGRAQMSAEQQAALDRMMPPSSTLARGELCVTAAAPTIDARAMLRESLRALHAAPWSCALSKDQPSVRSYFVEYACTTPAGGRAEGKGHLMMNGDAEYRVSYEGRASAVDAASGRPLDSRTVETRVQDSGYWKGAECMGANAAAVRAPR